MMHMQNTLYVTTPNAYLHKDGEAVVVEVDHEVRLRLPAHTLHGIVCFGVVSFSPPLMLHCAERGVSVSFLTEQGRFLARVEGPISGNVLLRREQYRWADDEKESARIAGAVVCAKVINCRVVLLRALRDYPKHEAGAKIKHAADVLQTAVSQLRPEANLDEIRGVEGNAARTYFEVFEHLVTTQKEDFFFRARSRRPPLDNMNALLSFLYALLGHDCRSALESVGLDPQVGFLHRDRPGRAGLALDLMEEFRPFWADRLALSLVNLRQVQGKGFQKLDSGAVLMNDDTRKAVLSAYQKRKQEDIQHPFLKERVQIGLLPYLQARLLSRYLRGDLDAYPPFFWK
ncbi:MAG: type I-C CRISPR-associated endonuclease Cas1c [Pseudomonadota bacterium]